MTKPFNWKIYFILLAAALFGLLAVLPYTLDLQAGALSQVQLPIPLWLVLTLQVGSQYVLFALIIALGFFLAGRIGLGLPILEARLKGEPVADRLRAIAPLSIVLGVLASVLIIALEYFIFQPAMKAQLGGQASALGLAGTGLVPGGLRIRLRPNCIPRRYHPPGARTPSPFRGMGKPRSLGRFG